MPENNIDKTAFGDCHCGKRKVPRSHQRPICFYCEVPNVGGHCSRCGEVRGAWSGDGVLCRDCRSVEELLTKKDTTK